MNAKNYQLMYSHLYSHLYTHDFHVELVGLVLVELDVDLAKLVLQLRVHPL